MRPTVLFGLLLATVSPLYALEIHFRPSYMELVSDGVSQRVRPGELVEVPVGDSMMDMEVSEQSPRKVEIRARGRCEFEVFGAPSVLEDSGKMTITMDPETKKLDIGWIKGEMKSAPASFDKSAAAAFFASAPEDFMRPLDFPGVRPFGYTDALEGRGSMVAEGDWRNLPPLPEAPARPGGYSRRPPADYYEDPGMSDWRTFEEEQNDLPPLALPPPTRERRPPTPTQVLMLSPATPTKSEPAIIAENESLDAEESDPAKPEDAVPSPEASDSSLAPPSPSPSPSQSNGQAPNSSTEAGMTSQEEETPAPSATPPPSAPPSPSEPQKEKAIAEHSAAQPSPTASVPSPVKSTRPAIGAPGAPSRPMPPGPTLYDRIVAQEEKQKEVIELLREVSKRVEEIKSVPPAPPPAPVQPQPIPEKKVATAPSPAPTPPPSLASTAVPQNTLGTQPDLQDPPVPPSPLPAISRSSSSPQAVQPIGASSAPAPSRPVSLGKQDKAAPSLDSPRTPYSANASSVKTSVPKGSSTTASSEDWDFTLEAVGSQR